MQQLEVINILKKSLNFNDHSIEKLKKFTNLVLKENQNYNLIAKSTENQIWHRQYLIQLNWLSLLILTSVPWLILVQEQDFRAS